MAFVGGCHPTSPVFADAIGGMYWCFWYGSQQLQVQVSFEPPTSVPLPYRCKNSVLVAQSLKSLSGIKKPPLKSDG